MAKVTLVGNIGKDNMKPRRVKRINHETGEEYYILTFKMFDAGSSSSYQVNLPDNEWGQKTFSHLSAGRKVQVFGYLNHNPNAQVAQNKELRAYANPIVNANQVICMDQNLQDMGNIVFSKMTETTIIPSLIEMIRETEDVTEETVLSYLKDKWSEYAQEVFNSGREGNSEVDPTKVMNEGPLS